MKNLLMKCLGSVLLVSVISTSASAACRCVCENNQKTWVCANSYDVPMGYCGGPCYGYNKPDTEDLSSNINSIKNEITVCTADTLKVIDLKK